MKKTKAWKYNGDTMKWISILLRKTVFECVLVLIRIVIDMLIN